MLSLGEVAKAIGAECHGDSTIIVNSVADVLAATSEQLSFYTNSKYLSDIATCGASALITSEKLSVELPADHSFSLLIMDNPYLGYARAAQLFDTTPVPSCGVHPSAVIAEGVDIPDTTTVGALTTIETGCCIGENVIIGPGCHLGQMVSIGDNSRLWSGVNIYHQVTIGKRAILQSGSVIGAEGFGFANDAGEWVKIPQLGMVQIGDDFEIGANSVIDRGALNDTIIGQCVKLDNLVHIAHNVEVGDATAMAAMTGIAGSTKIGKGCTLAGRTSIIGHLEICDNAHFTVSTLLTRSITESGVYSSGDIAQSNKSWKRKTARLRQLDDLFTKVRQLEKELKTLKQDK